LNTRRETLYSEFIGESARLLVDAMQRNAAGLQTLLPIHAPLSRIRLRSSKPVPQTAGQVLKTLLSTYSEPNITAEQTEQQAVEGRRDPLRQFSDICRAEWDSLQRKLYTHFLASSPLMDFRGNSRFVSAHLPRSRSIQKQKPKNYRQIHDGRE